MHYNQIDMAYKSDRHAIDMPYSYAYNQIDMPYSYVTISITIR